MHSTQLAPLHLCSRLQIEPLARSADTTHYLEITRHLLEKIFDKHSLSFAKDKNLPFELYKKLPLIVLSDLDHEIESLSAIFLVPSDLTEGLAKYIADTLSRWLLPGEKLTIFGQMAFHFRFLESPAFEFQMLQFLIKIPTLSNAVSLQDNLLSLVEEIKVNLMAVYRARYITKMKSYSHLHQQKLLQEVLKPLFSFSEETLYEQVQNFIAKISAEEKIHQVRENLSYLLQAKPKSFDLDLFKEMRQHANFFSSEFLSTRNQKHVSRLIAYHYLFKKVIARQIETDPFSRYLSVKISSTSLKEKPVLFVLMGMNFLKEMERFDARHFQRAVRNCIGEIEFIKSSFFMERLQDKMIFFYLEIYKKEFVSFTPQEVRLLRKRLPKEILRQIETVVHPIFMPRNEEDLLRNLLSLSREIRYLRDLPQATIHYEKQTDTAICFTVLLVRVKTEKAQPFYQMIQQLQMIMRIDVDDIRIAGYLKKKRPKEAAILRVTLEKKLFFRSDYSLDLLKARQAITKGLKNVFGEFRDFNGGLIIRQSQALDYVREELGPLSPRHELFLENYFYSIRPVVLQTVYEPPMVAKHFIMLLQILDAKLGKEAYLIHHKQLDLYDLIWIQAAAPSFKDSLIQAVGLPSQEFGCSFLQIDQWAVMGFIVHGKSQEELSKLHATLAEALKTWSLSFVCPIS